jgi:signal transduction histidine kinase
VIVLSSSAEAPAALQQRADEQGALRRVAEIVAHGATPEVVFEAVAREASCLLQGIPVTLSRFEHDENALVVLAEEAGPAPVGTRATFRTDSRIARVRDESRTVRVDDYTVEPDHDLAMRFGLAASVAAPIVVDDEVWGMFTATSATGPLARDAERRLEEFAELTAAAIGNAQARARVQELADEQGALRRVAEVVARGAPLADVFAVVAREASALLGDRSAALMRHDPDELGTVVAAYNSPAPIGLRVPSGPETPIGEMYRTRQPLRVALVAETTLRDVAQEVGVTSAVAVPITVNGRIWGNLSTSSDGPPIPDGTEDRLRPFAELAGLAIANTKNRSELHASRARIVAAADETRRRVQRDVHDGAQQRLVHTIISLKSARERLDPDDPAIPFLDEAIANAEHAIKDLRDIVRGILPEALTRRGLRAGIRSLAADLAIPVAAEVTEHRLPAHLETTAYFVIAEALTNVVKHAGATRAEVKVAASLDSLEVVVRDDGVGGADLQCGSGLVGLVDRVEANEGTLDLSSPPGGGTTLRVRLPRRQCAGGVEHAGRG